MRERWGKEDWVREKQKSWKEEAVWDRKLEMEEEEEREKKRKKGRDGTENKERGWESVQ